MLDRRRLLGFAAGAAVLSLMPGKAAAAKASGAKALSRTGGIDPADFDVRPGATDDQSKAFTKMLKAASDANQRVRETMQNAEIWKPASLKSSESRHKHLVASFNYDCARWHSAQSTRPAIHSPQRSEVARKNPSHDSSTHMACSVSKRQRGERTEIRLVPPATSGRMVFQHSYPVRIPKLSLASNALRRHRPDQRKGPSSVQ
jgi:hypothetical protein